MADKNFYKDKKILITGGLGFIGSNLTIKLVELGAKVYIIDSLIKEYGGNLFNIDPVKDKVEVDYTDIREANRMEKVVQGKDIIFNLAGTLSHVDSMVNPLTDLEINCKAQLSLLESVRKHELETRIIFAGTRNQYGKAKYLPIDEVHPQEPTDINGINNIAAEKYHLMYTSVYGIKTVSLRMSNTFGPRHQMRHSRQGVLNWFIRQIIDGETVTLYGNGKQIRDVNFIDDVVTALILVGVSDKGWGEAYNLGGTPISLIDFVKNTIKIAGRGKYKIKKFPSDRKKIEIGNYIASWDKIKKTYNWQPETDIDEGIKRTLEYYQRNKRHYW